MTAQQTVIEVAQVDGGVYLYLSRKRDRHVHLFPSRYEEAEVELAQSF